MILLSAAASVAEAAAELSVESLIRDLAFILILGAVTTLFFKWIKQPVVLGYIVAGFLASPNFVYLPSVTTENNIEFWAQIGIIVLLFSLGLDVRTYRYRRVDSLNFKQVIGFEDMCNIFRNKLFR